jgi:quercetin dioxygenase-like cupin family protein
MWHGQVGFVKDPVRIADQNRFCFMLYPFPGTMVRNEPNNYRYYSQKSEQRGPAMSDRILYPPMIDKLPEIDIPVPGVQGRLLQATEMQAVFFSVETTGEIPPHAHQAQWGVVLEGEMELTVDGVTRRCRRGESYYIPAGAVHAVRILSPMKALDVFDEPARYTIKKSTV